MTIFDESESCPVLCYNPAHEGGEIATGGPLPPPVPLLGLSSLSCSGGNVIRHIWVKCDHCEIEENYANDEDLTKAGWINLVTSEDEYHFCSHECLIGYL